MKKAALVGLGLFFLVGLSLTAAIRVEVKGSFFSSEDSNFSTVYGNGLKFGLEGGLDVAKNISVFAGLDYLHKTGALTVTADATTVSIVPLTVGARYEIPAGAKFRVHAGLGVQMVFFNEDTTLGTTSKSGLGFMVTGGGEYRVTESVGVGLFLAWSTCSMTNDTVDFKAGGLDLGAGVEIRF